MSKYKDISGQKFGRLTALYRLHNTKGRTKWLCVCECGNLKEVYLDNLRSNKTKSCGCYNKDSIFKNTTHKMTHTRLYRIWANMKNRCYNKNYSRYQDWGGRGIAVCSEWCEILGLNYKTIHNRINVMNIPIIQALKVERGVEG